jgi:hypothetical protein
MRREDKNGVGENRAGQVGGGKEVDIWNDDEGGILKEEGEETRKR